MAIITTPRRQRTNKKTWKKRVLSGKELAKSRREKLMKFRREQNKKNRLKKKSKAQRNLLKELNECK
tara:strand:+ start:634 stop:834 length:201 start_codon:yes stop_codon:yes gene_type:complete